MSKLADQVLEFSPQELTLLEQILKTEVKNHPESVEYVQPLLAKVSAHFAAAWPYDYKISQEQDALFEQAFKLIDEQRQARKKSDST